MYLPNVVQHWFLQLKLNVYYSRENKKLLKITIGYQYKIQIAEL